MAKQNTRTFGETPDQAINILGEGTIIKGDIAASSDIRIDGQLIGNLEAKGRVVIGPKGKIDGKVKCNNVEIAGFIKGKVTVDELLNMKASAKIEGDIIAGKLAVEPGATFTGTCAMGGSSAPAKEDAKEKPYTTRKTNSFIRYSSLGFEMMAIIGGFTFLGYKIDQWMDNEFKGFTLALVIFGVIASIIYGVKNLLTPDNKSKKRKSK